MYKLIALVALSITLMLSSEPARGLPPDTTITPYRNNGAGDDYAMVARLANSEVYGSWEFWFASSRVSDGHEIHSIFIDRNGIVKEFDPGANFLATHSIGAASVQSGYVIFGAYENQYGPDHVDLYSAVHSAKDEWETVRLGGDVNQDSWDSHPSVAGTKSVLFFSSNRPGGYGGYDIYYAARDGEGHYGKVHNAGPSINTPGNEISPQISRDEALLYYASDWDRNPGHKGGYDIYRSAILSEQRYPFGSDRQVDFGKPQNAPKINTQYNECFYMEGRDSTAYYSSDSVGLDLDIYIVSPSPFRNTLALDRRFKIVDCHTLRPVGAVFQVLDITSDDKGGERSVKLVNQLSDPQTGILTVALKAGNYRFIMQSESFEGLDSDLPVRIDVAVMDGVDPNAIYPIPVRGHGSAPCGDSIKIWAPVNFSTGSAQLFSGRQAGYNQRKLQQVVTELQTLQRKYPNGAVFVGGHTDEIGSALRNCELSKRRASSVVEFLRNAIGNLQIQGAGYGEDYPITRDPGALANRRVEVQFMIRPRPPGLVPCR